MRIEIIGRNYNVPDRLKSVIERKFEKLNKYFDKKETESKLSSYIEKDGAVAKFVCTQEKNRERYTLEATIYFGDRMIRAEETSENIYILELKMSDNGGVVSASYQISSRHYADAYAASSKPVVSLALEFDRESRGLIDWKML